MLELIIAAQINCLALTVFHEARSESRTSQIYVAATVKNRVIDGRWGSDFCTVMREPYQYSFMNNASETALYGATENEPEAWGKAMEVAYSVFYSGSEPILDNVLYYHGEHITPRWDFSKLQKIVRVDSHIFYGDKK